MKTTFKGKGGQDTPLKSLKEKRRDVSKAASATARAVVGKPKSGKSKMIKAPKAVATGVAMVAAVAGEKPYIRRGQNAMKRKRKATGPAPKGTAGSKRQ